MLKTPILFLVFNRTSTTKKVFAAIREAKPKQLFIAADGPREQKVGEEKKCREVRKITEKIDWPCKVKRLYSEKNLGCKLAVSGAIDWFFENVEEGIILEDDCLPNLSFFKFCEEMLEKYRGSKKIMHIGGNNFQLRDNHFNGYYFSKYPHIWGWATWRKAWNRYNVNITDWPKYKKLITEYNFSLGEKLYWNIIFKAVYRNKINTWDYQWLYAIWKNKCICITPGVNLVENIGFGKTATHTMLTIAKTNSCNLFFPLVEPCNLKLHDSFDTYTSNKIYRHDLLTIIHLNLLYL